MNTDEIMKKFRQQIDEMGINIEKEKQELMKNSEERKKKYTSENNELNQKYTKETGDITDTSYQKCVDKFKKTVDDLMEGDNADSKYVMNLVKYHYNFTMKLMEGADSNLNQEIRSYALDAIKKLRERP